MDSPSSSPISTITGSPPSSHLDDGLDANPPPRTIEDAPQPPPRRGLVPMQPPRPPPPGVRFALRTAELHRAINSPGCNIDLPLATYLRAHLAPQTSPRPHLEPQQGPHPRPHLASEAPVFRELQRQQAHVQHVAMVRALENVLREPMLEQLLEEWVANQDGHTAPGHTAPGHTAPPHLENLDSDLAQDEGENPRSDSYRLDNRGNKRLRRWP